MNYEAWLKNESTWMDEYRKKTMHQMKFITTPLVTLGLGLIMMVMHIGSDPQFLISYFFGGALVGLGSMSLVLYFMGNGLSGKRITAGINASVHDLGLSAEEKDKMARELSEAEASKDAVIRFTMNGAGFKGTPAEVAVSQNYAMMKGGTPLVQMIRLSDVDHVETGEEERSFTQYGGKTKTTSFFTLYTILFIGKTKDLGGFGFLESSVRDRVYTLIEKSMETQRDSVKKFL